MTGTWKDKDEDKNKKSIENFTLEDVYEDPSSYLLLSVAIAIIIVVFVMISVSAIGCDKDIKMIRI
jgi:hypothetical protein